MLHSKINIGELIKFCTEWYIQLNSILQYYDPAMWVWLYFLFCFSSICRGKLSIKFFANYIFFLHYHKCPFGPPFIPLSSM